MTSVPALQYCRLPQTACIEVAGAGATAFLHGQLSQRIADLPDGRAPLASWNDARGRMRALFRVVAFDGAWLLLTGRASSEAVADQLKVFVLRSPVHLRIRDDLTVLAVLGDVGPWLAARGIVLAAAANSTVTEGGGRWLRIGPELVYRVGPADTPPAATHGLVETRPEAIELAEIRLGIPALEPGLENRFLPQMLNLDLLGGIAFDKGCYPGQEVIARTHHLGSVKRRMRRFGLAGGISPLPGATVVDDRGEPAGDVIRAAPSGSGAELLAVVRLDRLRSDVFVGPGRDGPLEILALPYA